MKKDRRIEVWNVLENPCGDVYKSLLQVLCANSDAFYFITRKELSYDDETIAQFKPYMKKTYQTNQWAGTKTLGPPATVYVMEANEETCTLLLAYANNLYDWVSPKLPEDLTFLKNDFVWFSCTTHEEFVWFSIRSESYKNLMFSIEGLKLERCEH